jgi:hypothetical protein
MHSILHLLVVVQLAEDVLLPDEAGGVTVQQGVADRASETTGDLHFVYFSKYLTEHKS